MPCCVLGTLLVWCHLYLITVLKCRNHHPVLQLRKQGGRATLLTQMAGLIRSGSAILAQMCLVLKPMLLPLEHDHCHCCCCWFHASSMIHLGSIFLVNGDVWASWKRTWLSPHSFTFDPMDHIPIEFIRFLQCCLPKRLWFPIPRSWGNEGPEMMPQWCWWGLYMPAPVDGISEEKQHLPGHPPWGQTVDGRLSPCNLMGQKKKKGSLQCRQI